MKALCVGHSTFDVTLPLEKYPEENTKTRIQKRIECGGGPASNGAYLLAKWGLDTTICSVIGDDYYGDIVLDDFTKIGANTKYLEKKQGHGTTSSYIIANLSNGSRTIISSKCPPVLKLEQEVNDKADLILVDGEHPETAKEVLLNNREAISVLDAGRLNDNTKMLGKLVTYVVCCHEFAEEFTGKKIDIRDITTLKEIHKELQEYFNTNIIITLEANGSFTIIDGAYKIVPSVKVTAIDSTGAGDIFHGAFTYFIGMKYPLEKALHYASIAGALSVTRIGSRFSIPMLEEVLEYDTVL